MIFKSDGQRKALFCGQFNNSRWHKNWEFDHETMTLNYDEHKFPLINDPQMVAGNTRWVAPFITEYDCVFIQVLKINNLGQVSGGTLVNRVFERYPALLITPDYHKEIEIIQPNTPNKIDIDFTIPNDSYIIIAPTPLRFCMLPLLQLELGATTFEWRNWAYNGTVMNSYAGNPFGDITNTDWKVLDFSKYVSPLAQGVVGTLQAFSTKDKTDGCIIDIGRDTSNHTYASAGSMRSFVIGDGGLSNFQCAFGIRKELAVKVSPNTIGRVVITGWIE